jgi:hypothetical protein
MGNGGSEDSHSRLISDTAGILPPAVDVLYKEDVLRLVHRWSV